MTLGDKILKRIPPPAPFDPDVQELQQFLISQGFSLDDDGKFGTITEGILMQYQSKKGVPPTGQVDDDTLAAIHEDRTGGKKLETQVKETVKKVDQKISETAKKIVPQPIQRATQDFPKPVKLVLGTLGLLGIMGIVGRLFKK